MHASERQFNHFKTATKHIEVSSDTRSVKVPIYRARGISSACVIAEPSSATLFTGLNYYTKDTYLGMYEIPES